VIQRCPRQRTLQPILALGPYPLRSLDAIQLACALATAASLADDLAFVTADARLAAVARMEGFDTINPALAPPP
jgi:predicted nucleic acid-binding protein